MALHVNNIHIYESMHLNFKMVRLNLYWNLLVWPYYIMGKKTLIYRNIFYSINLILMFISVLSNKSCIAEKLEFIITGMECRVIILSKTLEHLWATYIHCTINSFWYWFLHSCYHTMLGKMKWKPRELLRGVTAYPFMYNYMLCSLFTHFFSLVFFFFAHFFMLIHSTQEQFRHHVDKLALTRRPWPIILPNTEHFLLTDFL